MEYYHVNFEHVLRFPQLFKDLWRHLKKFASWSETITMFCNHGWWLSRAVLRNYTYDPLISVLQGKIAVILKKFINADFPGKCAKHLTGYLAILLGAGLTILVQVIKSRVSLFYCLISYWKRGRGQGLGWCLYTCYSQFTIMAGKERKGVGKGRSLSYQYHWNDHSKISTSISLHSSYIMQVNCPLLKSDLPPSLQLLGYISRFCIFLI